MFKLLILVIFSTLLGCHPKKDFTNDFNQWQYNTQIIETLPKYDTIKQTIISNIDGLVYSNIDSTDFSEKMWGYTYMYNFDSSSKISGYSNDSLPKSILPLVKRIFKELGKNQIYGFSISKDSSMEIFIKTTHLKKYFLDVRERLIWKPQITQFSHLPFPFKDTMISKNWQYVIWFDKRSEIF